MVQRQQPAPQRHKSEGAYVIDFRKNKTACVERVLLFRFLGIELEHDLSWSTKTKELLKKPHPRQTIVQENPMLAF